MATKVVMEALSPTMEEGRLVEWKKQEGEPVTVGDVLAEVETDKAVMELVARAGGTLLKHIVEAGATVPLSEPVAVIGEPGEDGSGAAGQREGGAERQRAGKPQTQPARSQATQPAPDRDQPTSMPPAPPAQAVIETSDATRPSPAPAKTATPPGAGSRVRASPLAKRMAAERGVDLSALAGSGPEGRIIARDLAGVAEASSTGVAPPPLPRRPTAPLTPYTDVPLTQIRKTIARRLAQSIGPIPTFYLTSEVDMERLWDSREALSAGQQVKVSFNDIIIKAVAVALRQHPACNAWWQEDHIRYWNEVHVSMA